MVFGLIKNPKVPAEKQVNLYQYGFLSVTRDAVQGPGTSLSPQIGTDAILKVSVPQTGNAVAGFCPSAAQVVCAKLSTPEIKSSSTYINIFLFLPIR